MRFVSSRFRLTVLAALAALASLSAQAAIVTYVGTQGPKANLSDTTPPALQTGITNALAAFSSQSTSLGGNEFEGSPPALNFDYTGGAATISGGATIKNGAQSNPATGRYNMTPLPVDPNSPFGQPLPGHWLETSSNFRLDFSTGITAFSFFTTDLGDFAGSFTLELYNGNTLLKSIALMNTDQGLDASGNPTGNLNGNLLYFGATSSDPTESFTSARFIVSQKPGTLPVNYDIIGFDSFVAGQYKPVPVSEPGALALVGLALSIAGLVRRTRSMG